MIGPGGVSGGVFPMEGVCQIGITRIFLKSINEF